MTWYGDEFWPSKAELDREAYENWLAETYEQRFADFCREHELDPEDVASVLIFEQAWEEEHDQSPGPG